MKEFIVDIGFGSDHRGVPLKQALVTAFSHSNKHRVLDFGTFSTHTAFDYPIIAQLVCKWIQEGKQRVGVLICNTGAGMTVAANKMSGIRAVNVWNKELAQLAREHNGANVLCLGAKWLSFLEATDLVRTFLSSPTPVEGRHLVRLRQIEIWEKMS